MFYMGLCSQVNQSLRQTYIHHLVYFSSEAWKTQATRCLSGFQVEKTFLFHGLELFPNGLVQESSTEVSKLQVLEPDLGHCLFLSIKIYWNTTTPIHLGIVWDCFVLLQLG